MIAENIIHALSWTFAHSLWQGLLIGMVTWYAITKTSTRESDKRHSILLVGLMSIVVVAMATFAYYLPAGKSSTPATDNLQHSIAYLINVGVMTDQFSWSALINQNAFLISRIWMMGVVAFSMRLIFQIGQLRYITNLRACYPLPDMQETGARLARLMGINKHIEIYGSARVKIPVTFGWIKPVILLPIALINQLNSQEVEAILAHELAHIKRNDWIVNLFQSLMEVLFFYHPVVWIISNKMREERENSCDDAASIYINNKLDYAKLLLKMKLYQVETPKLVLGIVGKRNELLNRIKRLLDQPQKQQPMKEKLISVAIVLCVIAGFAFTKIEKETFDIPFLSSDDIKVEESRDITLPKLGTNPTLPDTLPYSAQGKSKITINNNGKTIEIEKENGEITMMKVDGQEVDPSEYEQYQDEMEGFDMDRFGNSFRFKFGDDDRKMFNSDQDGFFGMEEGKFNFFFDSLMQENFKNFDFGNGFRYDFPQGVDSMFIQRFGDSGSFSFGGDGFEKLRKMMEEGFGGEGFFMPDIEMFNGLDRMDMDDFDQWGDIWTVPKKRGTVSDKIGKEMSADGLLKIGEDNKVELTGKHLKINGEKQPVHLWEKYRDLWQDYSGVDMTVDSKVEFNIKGKKVRKKGLRRI